jgi:hypothetical protein
MIEHAPELCIFGTFEPGKHGLQISNTLIKVLSYSISNYAISRNVQMIESLVLSLYSPLIVLDLSFYSPLVVLDLSFYSPLIVLD